MRRLAAEAQGEPVGTVAKLNYEDALETVREAGGQPALIEVVAPAGRATLSRLNIAKTGDDLVDLPTVGKAAGKVLVENRPIGGYLSMQDAIAANTKVTKAPYTVDWERVEAYLSGIE